MANLELTQRNERIEAIQFWAEKGIFETGRERMHVERIFFERVARRAGVLFRPLPVENSESFIVHREIAFLIDSFDALPWRPDIAFDSVWKAFESASSRVGREKRVTRRLSEVAPRLNQSLVDKICAGFPMQSCEYLYRRLIVDVDKPEADPGVGARLKSFKDFDSNGNYLFEYLADMYGESSPEVMRTGAALLRRALKGELLHLGNKEVALGVESRSLILSSLFLYTLRNERFHGDSFSPFLSSCAKIKTYTHPYFAFLASYYLLLNMWLLSESDVLSCGIDEVVDSLDSNLEILKDLFGSHWGK